MSSENKINWHGAFFEAIKLELAEYAQALEFKNEVHLSQEALRMDVLIIKKYKDIKIEKNIGRIFRGHNIVEYKSEKDYMSIDDFYKVRGYAMLYKAFNLVDASDITITFVETRHPQKLFKYLRDSERFSVNKVFEGVYYIEGDDFPIQIIESKKLPQDENLLLRSLRSNLSTSDLANVFNSLMKFGVTNFDNTYMSSLAEANKNMLKEVFGMMSPELYQIIKEVAEEKGLFQEAITMGMEKGREVGREEGLELGIDQTVTRFAKELLLDGEPIEKIVKWTKLPLESIQNLQAQLQ